MQRVCAQQNDIHIIVMRSPRVTTAYAYLSGFLYTITEKQDDITSKIFSLYLGA